jgi:hypothetical protein
MPCSSSVTYLCSLVPPHNPSPYSQKPDRVRLHRFVLPELSTTNHQQTPPHPYRPLTPRMPRKDTPYKSALLYFKRDLEVYITANRPLWTALQHRDTRDTLWHGSRILRDYYTSRVGRHTLPGLPTPDPIPTHPFTAADAAWARTNHALTPQRTATGTTIAAWNGAPAGYGSLAIQVPPAPPPVIVNVPGPAPPPVQVFIPGPERIVQAPARPINNYPFDFWPPLPWDAEPASDSTLAWSIKDLKSRSSPEKSEAWLSNPPDQWPIREETAWRGGKFLGAGSFGSAGLWCEVDGAGNVVRRMVVKEVRPSGFKWRDPTFWREGLPREIRVHQKVDSSRPAADGGDAGARVGAGYANLLRHQGYRLMMQQWRFKLYLDFCAGGDLRAGLKAHFER